MSGPIKGHPYTGAALRLSLSALLRLGRACSFPFSANLAPLVFHLVDHVLGNGGLRIGGRLHRKSPLFVARLQANDALHKTKGV
jgi:hypothetical protein